jgi:hypothetical protein
VYCLFPHATACHSGGQLTCVYCTHCLYCLYCLYCSYCLYCLYCVYCLSACAACTWCICYSRGQPRPGHLILAELKDAGASTFAALQPDDAAKLAVVYDRYQQQLRWQGLLNFDDLLHHCLALLHSYPSLVRAPCVSSTECCQNVMHVNPPGRIKVIVIIHNLVAPANVLPTPTGWRQGSSGPPTIIALLPRPSTVHACCPRQCCKQHSHRAQRITLMPPVATGLCVSCQHDARMNVLHLAAACQQCRSTLLSALGRSQVC